MKPTIALAGVLLAGLLGAGPAAAGDPILHLSEVETGMECEGRSVIRGTQISSFDVEVLDVLRSGPSYLDRILVRVSGPAVDETGLGPGFSGSPIYCPGPSGPANVGAISEGLGDYGNKVALATPIQEILREPAEAPAASVARAHGLRGVRPLAAPLTFAGLTPQFARILRAAARSIGQELLVNPATAGAGHPPQDLVPGSALSVSLSSGDFAVGGIGTVAYRDSDRVWAFGHPFDGLGVRGLFLQDAFVHTVINNPSGSIFGSTYKLAAPGNSVGTIFTDGVTAVAGRIGQLPQRTQFTLTAEDADSGERSVEETEIADETALGLPGNVSYISSLSVANTSFGTVRGAGGDLSGTMCLRLKLLERAKPLRLCNRYFGERTFPGLLSAELGGDVAVASGLAEELIVRRPFHLASIEADLSLRRGTRLLQLQRASGPRRARRGSRIRIRARAGTPRGASRSFAFKLRVPRGLRPGRYRVVLTGDAGASESDFFGFEEEIVLQRLFGRLLDHESFEIFGGLGVGRPVASVQQLRKRLRGLRRYPGVRARIVRAGRAEEDEAEDILELLFGDSGGGGSEGGKRVHSDPVFGIGGRAVHRIRVLGPSRR